MESFQWTVDTGEGQQRIDKVVSERSEQLSRTQAQYLIKEGAVKVNEQAVKSNYKVQIGDVISVEISEPESLEIEPENIPLDIVYEDEDVIVVNKPSGMVVHPAPGHHSGTLVNALLYHCNDLSGINGVKRPGIVHRIDKDTSAF